MQIGKEYGAQSFAVNIRNSIFLSDSTLVRHSQWFNVISVFFYVIFGYHSISFKFMYSLSYFFPASYSSTMILSWWLDPILALPRSAGPSELRPHAEVLAAVLAALPFLPLETSAWHKRTSGALFCHTEPQGGTKVLSQTFLLLDHAGNNLKEPISSLDSRKGEVALGWFHLGGKMHWKGCLWSYSWPYSAQRISWYFLFSLLTFYLIYFSVIVPMTFFALSNVYLILLNQ